MVPEIEMLQFIGTVVVFGCVAAGFLLSGGNLLLLWHPTEVLIIVGAAFGAFLTSNPMKVVKASFSGALAMFKKKQQEKIEGLTGYFEFMRLDFPAQVYFEGEMYQSAAHAYNAARTTDPVIRRRVQKAPTL